MLSQPAHHCRYSCRQCVLFYCLPYNVLELYKLYSRHKRENGVAVSLKGALEDFSCLLISSVEHKPATQPLDVAFININKTKRNPAQAWPIVLFSQTLICDQAALMSQNVAVAAHAVARQSIPSSILNSTSVQRANTSDHSDCGSDASEHLQDSASPSGVNSTADCYFC